MSMESRLADLNRDLGELTGLFKAHIKETDRDRTARALQRTDDRADRQVMADNIARLAAGVAEINPLKDRVAVVEKSAAKFEGIYEKIAIAIGLITGGIWLAYEVVSRIGPTLKDSLLKLLK